MCEPPAHGFAGHPTAGSPLCRATMGRPGCPGPLGAASAPGWPAPLPQIIPSLGNVQGQEPMAPLAASRHRGSLPAGPSSGCCPSLESHQAYLSSGRTPSTLAPLLSPTALVPPPDTRPVGTTCYLVVGFASSPAHHRIQSSICLHRLCLHHTAFWYSPHPVQSNNNPGLASSEENLAQTRSALCSEGYPSLPSLSVPPLASGFHRSESSSPGQSFFWISRLHLFFSFQPHLEGTSSPGFSPAHLGQSSGL